MSPTTAARSPSDEHHADLGDLYRPARPHLWLLQRRDQQFGIAQPEPSAGQATTGNRRPPATPSAPTLLLADSNGSPGGETTTLTSPYLVGTTLAGASVQLLNASGAVVNTTTANSRAVTKSRYRARLALVRTPTKST